MSKKCCGYIRVSQEDQLKGFSLEFQTEEIRKYAEQQGYDLVHIYEERAESAKDLNRSQFQIMMKNISEDKYQTILIWRVDRFSRELVDLLTVIKELRNTGKNIIETTTNLNSLNENDDLQFIIKGYSASQERKAILQRTIHGMNLRSKKGLFNGGRVYGYETINKKLVVNDKESRVVEEIFELRAKGKGYKFIALQLNNRGIKTKQEKPFSINSVKTILNNVIYIGKIKWGEYRNWSEKGRSGKTHPEIYQGQHEPIITQELWGKVQEVNKKYKRKVLTNRTPKGELLLTGILRCPMCGYGTVMHKSKGHLYYMCQQYHNKGKTVCRTNLINKEFIENYVENIVLEVLKNEEILNDMIRLEEINSNSNTESLVYELEAINKEIVNNQAKVNKLDDEFLDGILSMTDYKRERHARLTQSLLEGLTTLNKQKEYLEEEIAEKSVNKLEETKIKELFKEFQNVYYSTDRLTKKMLLKSLIKRIKVSKDRKRLESIEFWFFPDYRLPLGELGRAVS
ncbi:recombinase family protein [Rossellomorea vietnamensis]|uniref:recombinase family protein n=1 Tax=Rossellomorea vietnamensis TaxID=218284 RepID=UPI003CF7A6B7